MKKIIGALAIICAVFLISACEEDEDRSFTIDNVTIDAQIDEEGIIHVRELYTYTFDGSFQGMTRSIESDVHQFKAYLPSEKIADPAIETEELEHLTIEKEDSTMKIHTGSQDETKQVLYSYIIKGSVDKYEDIADLTYSFFDTSNETDLHDVKISIYTPENIVNDETHFFLHDDKAGELTTADNTIIYTNDQLKAGENSEVRLIFPATELSSMKITENKLMKDEILIAEENLLNRSESLDQNMEKVVPVMWLLIAGVIAVGIIMLFRHPNRYSNKLSSDEFSKQLEEIDPLFASYLHQYGYLNEKNVIAALFSLKQRGIVKLKEVTSVRDEETTTFRFTWKEDAADVDLADAFLREWLFNEKDKEGAYFLLETIIDDEAASDSVREEKAKSFQASYAKWSGLVNARESYQHLKHRFHGFSRFSAILIFITYAAFYYMAKVDVISQTEQLVLSLLFGVLAAISIIFSRNKWLLLFYYPSLIIGSLIAFTMTKGTILTIIFFTIAFFVLLVIPSKYWKKDILKMKYAIKQSFKLMKAGEYPVGTDPDRVEQRLEYAMILGVGKQYAKQCNEVKDVNQFNFPLLSNPMHATETFNTGNLVLLTAFMTSGSSTASTTVSTSSTGGGGAGAF